MFIVKLIGKMLLLPIWVILGITWLLVHVVVDILGFVHGLWKLFFTLVAILAIAFGMYQNALICVVAIAITFLIVLVGSFIEVLLEESSKAIGRIIMS